VVPGITSGLAAPATAGIPVTHRRVASTVTLVTGHERPGKKETAINYGALAGLIRAGGTVCFYMGASRLGAIVSALVKAGAPPRTPLAVVQWGTTARQRCVRSTLARAAADVAAAGLGAPAIIVVGAVAGLRDPGWSHFTSRPLFGRCVLITRTRTQASELRGKLEEQGAVVLEAPTIELTPAPAKVLRQVDRALRNVRRFDWLVLTSANGVTALAAALGRIGMDARGLAGVRLAAIGDATARALRAELGLDADLVPKQFVAEALAAELSTRQRIKGKRFLLLRADIARPALPELLKRRGGLVTELAVYQTRMTPDLPGEVREALRRGGVDWVTGTSSSTVQNLVTLLGPDAALLRKVKIASIGPITTQTIRELGLEPTVEAGQSDIDGLVEAMTRVGG